MLHTPAVFKSVSSPFTVFREKTDQPLPDRFSPDTDYTVNVFAGGLIPLGTQVIRLEDEVTSWKNRQTVDGGRGVSGLLSILRDWRHQMSLEALPHGHTRFTDQLTVKASWLTPLMWPAFTVFWAWRGRSLTRVAKKHRSPLQDTWDSRYWEKGQLWSGRVNPWVEKVAAKCPVGRALDLGCGEGADALWLAERGWRVDAIDASAVAIFRGQEQARERSAQGISPLEVSWRVADLTTAQFDSQSFDFVSVQFLHFPADSLKTLWQSAIDAVAPGGTLLIVGHSVADEKLGIRRPPAPLLFRPEDLEAVRPPGWTRWEVTEESRSVESDSGSMTITDVVLVAER